MRRIPKSLGTCSRTIGIVCLLCRVQQTRRERDQGSLVVDPVPCSAGSVCARYSSHTRRSMNRLLTQLPTELERDPGRIYVFTSQRAAWLRQSGRPAHL